MYQVAGYYFLENVIDCELCKATTCFRVATEAFTTIVRYLGLVNVNKKVELNTSADQSCLFEIMGKSYDGLHCGLASPYGPYLPPPSPLMPRIPSLSPATGKPTKPHFIHTLNNSFVDSNGRTLLLRGVNLSGSSKAPLNEPSYVREALWESGESGDESFIGRPLNLDDGSADVHLAR